MADQYLQEQHLYHIAGRVHREREQALATLHADETSSWVMLRDNGDIVPLEHERIRHRANKVSLELSVPRSLQQGRPPFSRKSDSGTAYITTRRLIYIPARPTEEFKSFQAWILDCQDSYVGSPFFGAWYWTATVRPSPGGGVPPEVVRIELKLTFKEGGHSEFGQRFEELKERMEHVRRLQQETGQLVNIPDEPLPAYAPAGAASGQSPSTLDPQREAPVARSSSGASQNRRPNEPPPDYDEAQAQQLSMRLEGHIREGM